MKKVFLEISQNSQESTCAGVFSSEFCEISKSTFFYRTALVAASGSNTIVGEILFTTLYFRGSYFLKVYLDLKL